MGVPSFFRWLSAKYPKTIAPVLEDFGTEINGEKVPPDTTQANPNGEEFDNLYLDMNGIVHPCSHPEDREAPKDEEEMMAAVFEYTDRVVNMVRPRKLLYMAVDGVAPRAKMNQQRARRFRAAQEKEEADAKKDEFRQLLKREGKEIEETEEPKKTWDSNVITPGTPFMRLLAQSLRYWVAYKLNTDPMWAQMKVIISDATVPGEGEHKIMEFIRSQRRSQDFDPNTRHVIYGLDADLIFLSLSTHEPHFRVLREDVFFQGGGSRPCKICGQMGHQERNCRGHAKKNGGQNEEGRVALGPKPFIWLKINVLREYIAEELNVPAQGFPFDLERAIDDWVSLCFFVGNDFLPHLPSLAIREEGIDILVSAWRDNLPLMGGYMTKDGQVDLGRLQMILSGLALQENAIFKKRKQIDDKREANFKRRKMQEERYNSKQGTPSNQQRFRNGAQEDHSSYPTFNPADAGKQVRQITHEMMVNKKASFQAQASDTATANKSAAAVLKEKLMAKKGSTASQTSPEESNGKQDQEAQGSADDSSNVLGKRKADAIEENTNTPGASTPSANTPKGLIENPPPDNVCLWEDGYEERYYEHKFKADPKDLQFRKNVANSYVEGFCWVLLYYMQGCASWGWYYPYHYAPFAADFTDIAELDIKFDKSEPFRPYEQLMSVLPAASRHAIPEVFHPLMLEEDSPIIDFYPTDFELDLNGKKFAHQGVVLLPFIDEKRLLKEMHALYPELSADETFRNGVGQEALYFSTQHELYPELTSNWYTKKPGADKVSLKAKTSHGLLGKVIKDENYMPDSDLKFPLSSASMPSLAQDNSMSVTFEMPKSSHPHKSMLLRGVALPHRELTAQDLYTVHNKSERSGRNFGGAPLHNPNGGRINYANPVAQHLNPSYFQNGGAPPPPPHIAAQMPGFLPPPPPNWNGQAAGGGGYGNQNSYRGSHQNNNGGGYSNNRGGYNQGGYNQGGQGYNGGSQGYAPPPQQNYQGQNNYNGNGYAGGRGGGFNGGGNGGNDGYRGGRGGYPNGRGRGNPRY